MLPKAATIGLHHIPRAVLHDLSTSSLAALVSLVRWKLFEDMS